MNYSQNSGTSFSLQTTGTTSDLHGIFMLNELSGYAGGQNDNLLYTGNGGSTWVSRNTGIFQSVNAIHFPVQNLGAAACEAGAIYITTNGGLTWINDNSGTAAQLNDVYFPSVSKGWSVGDGGVIRYRGVPLAVTNVSSTIPEKFSLEQNFPNPFNPVTNIRFSITNKSNVNITIYDINGRAAEEIVNGVYEAGVYNADWNAAEYASGIYFYTIVTSEFTATKKMMLVK